MKKEYTEAEVYVAIKSGFTNLKILAKQDLKKRWKKMETADKYDAGRGLVYMGDVAMQPEKHFSRAQTQDAWIDRAEAFAFRNSLESVEYAYYIVPAPQHIVTDATRAAMRGELYGEYARFCDSVQSWEYDRTSPKGAYRCLAEKSANEIVRQSKKYQKLVDVELANPVKKFFMVCLKQKTK